MTNSYDHDNNIFFEEKTKKRKRSISISSNYPNKIHISRENKKKKTKKKIIRLENEKIEDYFLIKKFLPICEEFLLKNEDNVFFHFFKKNKEMLIDDIKMVNGKINKPNREAKYNNQSCKELQDSYNKNKNNPQDVDILYDNNYSYESMENMLKEKKKKKKKKKKEKSRKFNLYKSYIKVTKKNLKEIELPFDRAVLLNVIDKKDNTKKIIKIINKQKVLNSFGESWQYMMEYIISLNEHKNLMKIFNIYDDNKNFYIVMEKLYGKELFNFLVYKKQVKENICKYIISQILQAVYYLHYHNIIHRDIKPENLMFRHKKTKHKGYMYNYELVLIDYDTCHFINNFEQTSTNILMNTLVSSHGVTNQNCNTYNNNNKNNNNHNHNHNNHNNYYYYNACSQNKSYQHRNIHTNNKNIHHNNNQLYSTTHAATANCLLNHVDNNPASEKKKTTSENNKELEKETNKTPYEKYEEKKIYPKQKNPITNIYLYNQSKDITKRICSKNHQTNEIKKNINNDDQTNNHRTSSNKKYIKLVGTYGYIAPEIIKGFNYSILSDMWSIGIIFYILMTGITPLPMCLMVNYKNTKDILLKKEKKGINFNLLSFHNYPIAKDLCEQFLQFDPNKRISSTVSAANHPWLKYFHILNKNKKKKKKKKKKKNFICTTRWIYQHSQDKQQKKEKNKKRNKQKNKNKKNKNMDNKAYSVYYDQMMKELDNDKSIENVNKMNNLNNINNMNNIYNMNNSYSLYNDNYFKSRNTWHHEINNQLNVINKYIYPFTCTNKNMKQNNTYINTYKNNTNLFLHNNNYYYNKNDEHIIKNNYKHLNIFNKDTYAYPSFTIQEHNKNKNNNNYNNNNNNNNNNYNNNYNNKMEESLHNNIIYQKNKQKNIYNQCMENNSIIIDEYQNNLHNNNNKPSFIQEQHNMYPNNSSQKYSFKNYDVNNNSSLKEKKASTQSFLNTTKESEKIHEEAKQNNIISRHFNHIKKENETEQCMNDINKRDIIQPLKDININVINFFDEYHPSNGNIFITTKHLSENTYSNEKFIELFENFVQKKKKKILSFHNNFNEFPIINNNNNIEINQNYIQGNLHLQNIKNDIHLINKQLDIKKKKNEYQTNHQNYVYQKQTNLYKPNIIVKSEKENERANEKNNEKEYKIQENYINNIEYNNDNIQIYKDKKINFMNTNSINMYHDNISKNMNIDNCSIFNMYEKEQNEIREKILNDSTNEQRYLNNNESYDYNICNNNTNNHENEYNTYTKFSHTTPKKRSHSLIQQNLDGQYEETQIYDIRNDIHDNNNNNDNINNKYNNNNKINNQCVSHNKEINSIKVYSDKPNNNSNIHKNRTQNKDSTNTFSTYTNNLSNSLKHMNNALLCKKKKKENNNIIYDNLITITVSCDSSIYNKNQNNTYSSYQNNINYPYMNQSNYYIENKFQKTLNPYELEHISKNLPPFYQLPNELNSCEINNNKMKRKKNCNSQKNLTLT
ncbi:calcium/calmodulin-dependent protein kinase, putative [Plasmodium gaboni]|uniref:Calcium/calmodulin-dependent protein kinase, putative n=1 Tax=Plasmodium gaboni TaxID=647221 RepID=A0ABY1UNL4_9APIC|nr:calcium/calmodulin-dependent protein kinase, putative [Plasmodium gaboni]